MRQNGHGFTLKAEDDVSESPSPAVLEWDWDIEHADRKKEAKADAALHGAHPFQVDRKILKDVVREKMGADVARITFLSAGTFHKAYLVTLVNRIELVARVARRFMPRLKTESEVATMKYLREHTPIPVPNVYHFDSNPYNRLGGEYILMSKARGVPLSRVYHSMPYTELVKLLTNLAALIVPLFAHRFPLLGSLYSGPPTTLASAMTTPKPIYQEYTAFPLSRNMSTSTITSRETAKAASKPEFHVGPIISWPFFGSNRGELSRRSEIDRGPWSSTQSYLLACAEREISGVVRENEGKSAPHKLHLDPAEIFGSRHHHLKAVPDDRSDDSDEWDLEESEDEWEGPGDNMYRDYRRMQRSTFLVAHLSQRKEAVRREMERWVQLMEKLGVAKDSEGIEEFGLDCHDLSLENVFVDEKDHSKISCIIDWESTTTRPLWACAHLPVFLQSGAFAANLFRDAVSKLGTKQCTQITAPNGIHRDLNAIAREWLHYESFGTKLRMAHRFVEWDGWEEGLIDSILGPVEHEEDWFKDVVPDEEDNPLSADVGSPSIAFLDVAALTSKRKPSSKLPFVKEKEREQVLTTTGDICGGRGGELGRRLEAWLSVTGSEDGESD